MSQTEDILKHMRSGKKINPLQALNEYGSLCLAQRIYDIQTKGMLEPNERLKSQFITVGKAKKEVKEYLIERNE